MKTNVMTRAAQKKHQSEQHIITKKKINKPVQASDRKLRSMPNFSANLKHSSMNSKSSVLTEPQV